MRRLIGCRGQPIEAMLLAVMHQVTATKAIDSGSQDQMGRISGAGLLRR